MQLKGVDTSYHCTGIEEVAFLQPEADQAAVALRRHHHLVGFEVAVGIGSVIRPATGGK